jgi:O-methyltransferase
MYKRTELVMQKMNILDRLCRKWLTRKGYRVLQPDDGSGGIAANGMQLYPDTLSDPSEYSFPDDLYRLLRPWNSSNFKALLTPQITENTMLNSLKLYILYSFAMWAVHQQGDFLEAGVHNGGSARLLLNVLQSQQSASQLWLLDTFKGYSCPSLSRDGSHAKEGDCRGLPRHYVEQLLNDGANQTHFIEGAIPGTLPQVSARDLTFAHIDVNLYEPTLAVTEFCLERLTSGGIIVFDDYGWPATYGARTAIDEACRKFSQTVISVPESTQAFLVKTHA